MQNKMPIQILNTFSDDSGTEIMHDIKTQMEKTIITGIAIQKNLVMVTLSRIKSSDAELLLVELLEIGMTIESINQSNMSFLSAEDHTITFDYHVMFSFEYFDRFMQLIDKLFQMQDQVIIREKLSKITILGIGIKNDNTIMKTLLDTLRSIDVSPISMQILETQLSFVVEQISTDQVVRTLHTKLGLDIV
jgi:aspartate kinase